MSLVEDPTDQVSADHEEDVHSDEPSGNQPRKGVVDHYSKHRHGSQSVYVCSVFKVAHRAGAIMEHPL